MITATIGKNHYETVLTASSHHLLADETQDKGGTNLGPAPEEFLMMSLASCTAITLRMYADRKKWPVEKIRVEVKTEKSSTTTIFHCQVYLEGVLDGGQRQRLLQIAKACPVHKTLTNPIEIKTELL